MKLNFFEIWTGFFKMRNSLRILSEVIPKVKVLTKKQIIMKLAILRIGCKNE